MHFCCPYSGLFVILEQSHAFPRVGLRSLYAMNRYYCAGAVLPRCNKLTLKRSAPAQACKICSHLRSPRCEQGRGSGDGVVFAAQRQGKSSRPLQIIPSSRRHWQPKYPSLLLQEVIDTESKTSRRRRTRCKEVHEDHEEQLDALMYDCGFRS